MANPNDYILNKTGDLAEKFDAEKSYLIDFEALLKSYDLESVADTIIESSMAIEDFMKKDAIDRLLDFAFFKIQTGYVYIPSMAYPTKRMMDKELEKKIKQLINELLYPEIVLHLLKVFARNVHNSDLNLYIANLIESENIIRSIYETYKFFKKDIFIPDPEKRIMNVKRIQQFLLHSDRELSSPLDAAARLKYILEFFLITRDVSGVYSREDLLLSAAAE